MQTVVKALDAISGAATPSESVADAILALDGLVISDGAAAVAAALGPTGDITLAIDGAIEDALEPAGDIAEAIAEAIPQAATQADSGATTVELLLVDFNALLAKLKAAGLMATE